MKYHVEGYFEGKIEANSEADAEMNFSEMDIADITIHSVWEVEEDDYSDVSEDD